MVLWICLGIVVVALVALGVLLVELNAKKKRMVSALALAQKQTKPAIDLVATLTQLPPPSLSIARPQRTLIGARQNVVAAE